MSTIYDFLAATTSNQVGKKPLTRMHVPEADVIAAHMAAIFPSLLVSQNATGIYGPFGPSSYRWTQTTTGTSAALALSTAEGGGALMTCGSDSTFNTNMESVMAFPALTGRHYGGMMIVEASDITHVGFKFGFGNSQVDPFTTMYTDFVGISKAIATGVVTGEVRGNSGTKAVSSTMITMANTTRVLVGFEYYLTASTSTNHGFFYSIDATNGLQQFNFTADQLTQLAAILTTPPTMYANVSAKGTTGNTPTLTVPMAAFYMGNII